MAKKSNSRQVAPIRPKSKSGRRYNWRPDLPDQRDFLFSERLMAPVQLPNSVDLRKQCSPVFDQGKIGSCTGNALAGALEFLQLKQLNTADTSDDTEVFEKKFASVSRLFIYYNERVIEGHADQDSGAMLRDGVKSLLKWGSCREKLWSYSPSKVFSKPGAPAYKEAATHQISAYLRLRGMNEMKQCLALGFPFVFGFSVFESFESPDVAKTGIMPMPAPDEQLLGGHAVMAVGYDDQGKYFWVRNSWGTKWGQDGYFRMPYAYIEAKRLAQDFWTLRK